VGEFFRGLLYYYQLELVHLVPNSITLVSTFIHFCEAYLGISPHFLLWRYFFCVKSTGKRSGPVGAVIFTLRSGPKAEWMDTDLPDNTVGWRSEWFYIADQLSGLPRHTGHKLVKINEWDLGLSFRDLGDLKGVLELVGDMKKRGVSVRNVVPTLTSNKRRGLSLNGRCQAIKDTEFILVPAGGPYVQQ
jgi:hypothetical protein